MAQLSPMMQQYLEIKEQYKDTLVFFRLGDFYELFFDDAKLVSRELELTLTGRDCGLKERAPMCGVPYHSYEPYVAKLVSKGYKIAICEQMEDPSSTKGIVKRGVTRIITPGTVMENSMLDEDKNNFICSIFTSEDKIGLCFCDVSTGDLFSTEIERNDEERKIKNELTKYYPREVLINSLTLDLLYLKDFMKEKLSCIVEMIDDVDLEISKKEILEHFKKKSLEELNIGNKNAIISSLSSLLSYLKKTQKAGLERINTVELYSDSQFMKLDMNTRRNLELIETMRNKERRGSLLNVIDKTKTSMGKRLMRTWIEQPLVSCARILRRHDAVEEFTKDLILMDEIGIQLTGIYDMERLMSRIVYGSTNGRELRSLSYTLEKLPELKKALKNTKPTLLSRIYKGIDELQDVKDLIENSIDENAPITIKDGGVIKSGYNKELDQLRYDMTNVSEVMSNIETREKEKTGITKLKIGYNKVFGYYIEVSNSFKDKVPEDYIRKQTLSNCERFITQELKSLESRMLGAKEKSMQLEYTIFEEIRNRVAKELIRIQSTAKMISKLDVLLSFAKVSVDNNYIRPVINMSGKIILKDSRHPVVEKLLNGAPFVPNDVLLDKEENRAYTITGPNMAGKSTFMRQVAVIVLMAQIGCFVPASSAEIGVVDSIFTRVGASDDLASGQSTFMVEMSEVAQILKDATNNSLLLFDEIGRGTSTFDGMSIARAVLEYSVDKKKLGAKTLFATHYHELTDLENTTDGVKNYNVAVKKRGDDITFLRRIVRGGTDDSYGIEVAKLAGVPDPVIKRAKVILNEIESSSNANNISSVKRKKESKEVQQQISFTQDNNSQVIERLKKIDMNTLTPIESMNLLFEIIKMIK